MKGFWFVYPMLICLLLAGPTASAPINFSTLQDRTWVRPGEVIGYDYSFAEVSWAYDSYHKKFVRYGGCTGGYTNEVYAYYFNADGNFVSQEILPCGSTDNNRPGTGCSRGICYDSKRHIVWGYGGIGAPPIPTSGNSWALMGLDLSDNSFRMAPGSEYRMGEVCQIEYGVYDDAILLVGRDGGAWHQTRLYEFSKSAWRMIGTEWDPNVAGPRSGIDLTYSHPVYDPESHSFVLLLGSRPETWVFAPSTMTDWERRTPSPTPSARTRYGMAYDPVLKRIILQGGRNGETDTWAYHVAANTWTQINTTGAQSHGTDGVMPFDYDFEHNVFVAFTYGNGGAVSVFRNSSSSATGADIEKWTFVSPAAKWAFPNPITHLTDLRFESGVTAASYPLFLYSPEGMLIWSGSSMSFNQGIGLAGAQGFPAGTYFLRREATGRSEVQRITVVK